MMLLLLYFYRLYFESPLGSLFFGALFYKIYFNFDSKLFIMMSHKSQACIYIISNMQQAKYEKIGLIHA